MSDIDDAYDDDALAAEYVLHLLGDSERAAVEARLSEDHELRRRVVEWEARLAPLAEDVSDIVPPATVRSRLLRTVEEPTPSRPAWGIWAWLAGGIVAAGVLLFITLGPILDSSPDMTPAFRAELASDDRSIVMVASVIPATHEVVVESIAGSPPEGLVHELWLIAEGTDTPVSLGLLDSAGTTRIRVPDEIAPGVRTGTIAISEEPPGGSPTGAPTGRVVAAAQFSDI